jgi:hypothetical protein
VKVVSFHDYEGGNGVPAGIYGWDEYGRAVAKYNVETGEFEKFEREVSSTSTS